MFCKKDVLKNVAKFTGRHLRQSLFFNKVEKETLAQMFFCEFYKIKNFENLFYRTSPLANSVYKI